jgi:8-oxo-dGTP diphosphatase
MAPIRVVGAVALRRVTPGAEPEVFMARRPPRGRHGGLWEFPGGKVEPGEGDGDALARELREELDVDATVGPLVAVGRDERIELYAYAVELRGIPRPTEGQDCAWTPLSALRGLKIPPADRPVVEALLQSTPGSI